MSYGDETLKNLMSKSDDDLLIEYITTGMYDPKHEYIERVIEYKILTRNIKY